MAGHSQFKNIMYRKGAQDAKRAKLFTKLAREITVAVKESGDDPTSNPRLRSAIAAARAQNMPNANIDRAIKRGQGADGSDDYSEVRYEGYGPGGIAVIVDALTDNRNRTASEVRSAFSKHGGNLGETNSASVMFERVGRIVYPRSVAEPEAMFEAAVEAGASDVESGEEVHEVICAADDFSAVRDGLSESLGDPQEARLGWKALSLTPVDEDTAQTLFKLIDVLEDNDDVQQVSANFEVSDEVLQRLTA